MAIKVFINNSQLLKNLTDIEKERIKKDLTFKNPEYESILKFSRWGSTKVPEFLYYYKEIGDSLEVPRGYKIPFDYEVIEDASISFKNIEYPLVQIQPRKVQQVAIEHFTDNTGTLVINTGLGKSIIGLMLAGKLKERALIIVNKDDLIDGWQKDALLCYGEIEIGLVKGKVFNIGKQITLTTIQTLSRLGDEKLDKLKESISMLICDECHRCSAKIYSVLNGFPARYRLGLTATKMRNDGLADVLDLICGHTLYEYKGEFETSDIIDTKDIFVIKRESQLKWNPVIDYYWTKSGAKVKALVYKDRVFVPHTPEWKALITQLLSTKEVDSLPVNLQEAYKIVSEDLAFNRLVVEDIIKEYNSGKSCIVFCKEKEHINLLYDMLVDICPRIQKYYGDMKETKAEIKEKAETKEALITLATISISCEGTNVKSWERGFLVSTVANKKDLIQILGRLRRTKDGKTNVFFYDYRHPFMTIFNKHGVKRDKWYREIGITKII